VSFLKFIIPFLIIIFAFSGCTAYENVISADGSTSAEKIIGGLGEAFNNKTGIKFTFNPTGSASGINAVIENRCDIGVSSRELTSDELSKVTPTVFAYDSIVLVVNAENNISDLSLESIKKIFTGQIKNWKYLGGNDAQIVLIGREAGSGTRDGFEESTDTKNICKYRQELTSSGDIITAVSNNPDAIGYVSFASVKNNIKVLTVNKKTPDKENVISGAYPIRRPFMTVTKKDAPLSKNSEQFLKFILSDEAENIITKMGAIPSD